MTDHNQALDLAILAAGLDPRNELVRKSSQALVEKYIEARNASAFRWMWEEDLIKSGTWSEQYDDERPGEHPQVRNIRPLFAAPVSAGGETVKVKPLDHLMGVEVLEKVIAEMVAVAAGEYEGYEETLDPWTADNRGDIDRWQVTIRDALALGRKS